MDQLNSDITKLDSRNRDLQNQHVCELRKLNERLEQNQILASESMKDVNAQASATIASVRPSFHF